MSVTNGCLHFDCANREQNGYCKLTVCNNSKYNGSGLISTFQCPIVPAKPTNADRIRAMSDEELAEFLTTVKCRGAATESYDAFWEDTSHEIDWLKQEAI